VGDSLDTLKAALDGRYTIQRELGRGGMATVYLAADLQHHRRVALKVLLPELAAVLGSERFLREITLTAGLSHPHIVPVLDSGAAAEPGGGAELRPYLWYAMPYVEGESLRDLLARETQLPVDMALALAREVASALDYAHAQGVIHRDIKPENILLSGGQAVVADFGVAKAVGEAGGRRLTETGLAVGTPAYMSPEQALGQVVDRRSDVYALGAVVYEMLVGEPPYTGPTAQAIIARRLHEPVPSVRVVREGVPVEVEAAVQRALAKVPADRFATAGDFVSALSIRGAAALPPPARLQWRPLVVLAAALAVILGMALLARVTRTPAVSATRIAVFPFTVQGDSAPGGLSAALTDLMSEALDDAGELHRVDPGAIMQRLGDDTGQRLAYGRASGIAGRLGAGRLVLGTAVTVGQRLRVSAVLYDATGGDTPLRSIVEEGVEAELPDLVDRLAAGLITALPEAAGPRLAGASNLGASRFAALKPLLQGEARLRRGEMPAAAQHLRQAIAADSAYALAWWRLLWVQNWCDACGDESVTLDQLARHFERLPRSHLKLVEGHRAELLGDGAEAERLYLLATGASPGLADAWFRLGNARLKYSWQLGHQPSEARVPLERALAIDPSFLEARVALSWMALRAGEYDLADSLRRGSTRLDDARDDEQRLATRFALATPAERAALFAGLGKASDGDLRILIRTLALTSDSLEWAERAGGVATDPADRGEGSRATASLLLANLEAGRGRWEAAMRALNGVRGFRPGVALFYRACLGVLPFLELPPDSLRSIEAELLARRGELDLPAVTRNLPPELDGHAATYVLGLLRASQGDVTGAEGFAASLESARQPLDAMGLRRDLAYEIRALAQWREGQPSEALQLLDHVQLKVTSIYQTHDESFLYLRPLARLLRAESLIGLGRDQEAYGWLAGFGVLHGTEYTYLAPAFLRLGQIHERRGEREQALHYYRRFLARWRDADERLRPRVDSARVKASALAVAGSR
jgi:tetratricopeptide (TPR) repeat protein